MSAHPNAVSFERPGVDLAKAEARIRRILASKNVGALDYWSSKGKERFRRELGQDGASTSAVDALLARIDNDLFRVDLGEILEAMRDRESRVGGLG